jgi:predicted DNA-binding transcriptional regulator YafY
MFRFHARLWAAANAADPARARADDRRTGLRDVDALSEAGLPIITLQGQRGAIELASTIKPACPASTATRPRRWR